MLESVQSRLVVMLFGSGSQPNSKFQVNNNVWIWRNQVQSLQEHSKLFLATRLLPGLPPRFSNTQPGETAGVPLQFLSYASTQYITYKAEKYN